MKSSTALGKAKKDQTRKRELLKLLTYERRERKPIYYRDYKRVLVGELPPEAVMGSGFLQAVLVQLIATYLWQHLGKNYLIATNEVGFKISKATWYNLDIAIWNREDIKKPLPKGYIEIPPKVVIEVDSKVDLEEFEKKFGIEYYTAKTEDLLKAGVEKVIWVFTPSQKVLVAEKDKPWLVVDWNYPVEVLEGVVLNLKSLVKENL